MVPTTLGKRMSARESIRGVTLIELVVTIAIVAIGAALAYPSFTGLIRSNRVATATNNFIAAVNLARTEAIRSNRGGGLCPSVDGDACSGTDWNAGMLVFTDTDGGGTWSAGDVAIRFFELSDGLGVETFDGNGESGAGQATTIHQVAFNDRGRPDSDMHIEIVPDDCPADAELVRRVVIARTGQARMSKEKCE